MERNRPSDPRNGKHRLNQVVTEFVGLSQSSKRHKSDLPETWKYIFFWGFFFHLLLHLPS